MSSDDESNDDRNIIYNSRLPDVSIAYVKRNIKDIIRKKEIRDHYIKNERWDLVREIVNALSMELPLDEFKSILLKGDYETIKVCIENNNHSDWFNEIMDRNDKKLIKYIASNVKIPITQIYATKITKLGCNINDIQVLENQCLCNGDGEIINIILNAGIKPNNKCLENLCYFFSLNDEKIEYGMKLIIKIINEYKLKPSIECLKISCDNGSYKMTKMLCENFKLEPTIEMFNDVVKKCNTSTITTIADIVIPHLVKKTE